MPSSSSPDTPDEALRPCQFCGAFTALQFGDLWICEDCRQARGSCCTEFDDEPDDGQDR